MTDSPTTIITIILSMVLLLYYYYIIIIILIIFLSSPFDVMRHRSLHVRCNTNDCLQLQLQLRQCDVQIDVLHTSLQELNRLLQT